MLTSSPQVQLSDRSRRFDVRPFAGDADELSQFVISAWRSTYQGTVPVPHWSGDYFRWQLRLDEPGSERRIVCAYDGDTPAGVVIHFPMQIEVGGKEYSAAQASWLSVAAEYRGQGVAKALNEGSRAVLRDTGCRFKVGYGYFGSKQSLGLKFWRTTENRESTMSRKAGFWSFVLDPARVAAWNVNRLQGFLARLSAPLLRAPRERQVDQVTIREVEADDVPRCLELVDQQTQGCDCRLIWNADRLGRMLGLRGFSQSLVAIEGGGVKGFIGYHILPIEGKRVEPVGILDLVVVEGLSHAARRALLNAVLVRLRAAGAILALKLRTGDYPGGTFLHWGWVPMPADSQVIFTWADSPEPLVRCRRMHLLWR